MEYSNLVLLTKFINLRLSENLSSVSCYETKSYRTKQQEISLHPTQQGILCQQEILIMHSPWFIFLYVPKINFILLDRIDELTSDIEVKVHKCHE